MYWNILVWLRIEIPDGFLHQISENLQIDDLVTGGTINLQLTLWDKLQIYDYWLYEYEYRVEERGWKFENVWIKNVQNVDRVEKNDDEDYDDQTSW